MFSFSNFDNSDMAVLLEHKAEQLDCINELMHHLNNLTLLRVDAIRRHRKKDLRQRLRNSDADQVNFEGCYFDLLRHEYEQTDKVVAILTDSNSAEHKKFMNKIRDKYEAAQPAKYQAKLQQIQLLTKEVAPFANFLHLTAAELMVSAVIIDAVHAAILELQNGLAEDHPVLIRTNVLRKQLKDAKKQVSRCMQWHSLRGRSVASNNSLTGKLLHGKPCPELERVLISRSEFEKSVVNFKIREDNALTEMSCSVESIPIPADCEDGIVFLKRKLNQICNADYFWLTEAFSFDQTHQQLVPVKLHAIDPQGALGTDQMPTIKRYLADHVIQDGNYFGGVEPSDLKRLIDYLESNENCLSEGVKLQLRFGETRLFVKSLQWASQALPVVTADSPAVSAKLVPIKPIQQVQPILSANSLIPRARSESAVPQPISAARMDVSVLDFHLKLIDLREELLDEKKRDKENRLFAAFARFTGSDTLKDAKLDAIDVLLALNTVNDLKRAADYYLNGHAATKGAFSRLCDICEEIASLPRARVHSAPARQI